MDWRSLNFKPFAADDAEQRYLSLVRHLRHHDPDVICVNESMPWLAFVERLGADLGMDVCVHLGVAGICLGPLKFPCISEGDAILAKPHLRLQELGRRSLTGSVLTNQVSLNTDDATQALAARITLPSGADVVICCTHWHAWLLDNASTRSRIQDMKAAGESAAELKELESNLKIQTEIRKKEALDTAKFVELAASRVSPSRAVPVIVCGDLNTTADTPEVALLYEHGYVSASHGSDGLSPGKDLYTWDPDNPQVALQIAAGPERASSRSRLHGQLHAAFAADPTQLDHVFFKNVASAPQLEVLECKVVLSNELQDVVPSDHYGLLVDFTITQ